MQVLNWHLNSSDTYETMILYALITTFSLIIYVMDSKCLRDYYTSYHSTFHEFYRNHPDITEIDETLELDYEHEADRLLQALMLGNSWSYQEEKSEIFNVFWVSP